MNLTKPGTLRLFLERIDAVRMSCVYSRVRFSVERFHYCPEF